MRDLIEHCQREGKFPDRTDISNYLEVLGWIVGDRKMKDFSVDLVKYADNPGVYCIDNLIFPVFHISTSPETETTPFYAKDDSEAMQELEKAVSEYNSKREDSRALLSKGEIIEKKWGNGMLIEMCKNPSHAVDLW